MDNPGIGEKEYKLLSQVSKDPTGTQREISRQLGFSLGMTNILLKRLIHKGYIKISQLNRRKVKYFLTPRGIAQKIKRTHQYLSYTFHSLKEIKYKIQTVLLSEYKKGRRKFIVSGHGELADITDSKQKIINNKFSLNLLDAIANFQNG